MTVAAVEALERAKGSNSSGRRVVVLFVKVALVTSCFVCLNLGFNYSSLPSRSGVPPREEGTWLAAWIGDVLEGSATDRNSEKEAVDTRVELYNLADVYRSGQVLGRFRNVCYNGSHILTLGDREAPACENALKQAPNEGWGPLVPLLCNDTKAWDRYLSALQTQYWMPFDTRERDWLLSRSRSGSVQWEVGTTSFIFLDRSTSNLAHFVGKMNMLTLFNGASIPVPALRNTLVDRFYFPLYPGREQLWANTPRNQQGFHATFLAANLNRVLAPFHIPELRGPDLVSGDGLNVVAAQGRAKLGRVPFMNASEDRPLCFQNAFLPGILKHSHYVGLGVEVADIMRQHFRDWLHLEADTQPPGTDPAVLLYSRRDGKRRIFSPESEQALTPVLEGMQGFTVRNISFGKLSFREQLKATQEADVVIALHGANLVNPSLLARKNSVLIELSPYRVLHRAFETQAIQSGLIYMSHQLGQGRPQPGDDEGPFKGLAYITCMNVLACKSHFVQERSVVLDQEDLQQIQTLLSVARRIHFELTRHGITVADPSTTEEFHAALVRIVKEEAGLDISCGEYRSTRNDRCRCTWLAFADDGGVPTLCYLAIRCSS